VAESGARPAEYRVNSFSAFRAVAIAVIVNFSETMPRIRHTPLTRAQAKIRGITRVDSSTSVIEGRESERADGGRGEGGSPGERAISANDARACECVQFNDFQPEFR